MVEANFGLCGSTLRSACVIDGDTFRLGSREIRVVGIDTAEKDARCQREADLAHRSTEALREWLDRGPFLMTGAGSDRYGRELQTITRAAADGKVERLADYLVAAGLARHYTGGQRLPWC